MLPLIALSAEWIDVFSMIVHLSNRLDYIYTANPPGQSTQKQHKEELPHHRVIDAADRCLIAVAVEKYPQPLEHQRPHLYTPVTGLIATSDVNVAVSMAIREKMESKYIASLPDKITTSLPYNSISSPINTMDMLKTHAKDTKVLPVIDLQNIFLRLLMIGQWRGMELEPLFAYVLCAVPPALIDKHGCLRKSSKSGLMKRLGVLDASPAMVDVVIVDVSQLFYHIV